MKRYNNQGQIETISSKMVFDMIEKNGEGNFSGYSIYEITNKSDEKAFRVDCGFDGSFEIRRIDGEEEFDLKCNDWIWVKGTIYTYSSCSTIFAGYPFLPIEKAYDKLK